ncbi:MAG: protein-L-isoaspartate(D-aspartate) O-methyltransferase [Myxococcales bacterium FL481]|nr:MAG: protein-L-isoaspartate(D-aspartate) O-methyltransferase [Myxococcales bacterium FL481]
MVSRAREVAWTLVLAPWLGAVTSCGTGADSKVQPQQHPPQARREGDERQARARQQMVDVQLAARDIRDERVLAAMRDVPRDRFVPEPYRRHAHEDRPLPIGHDVTISQPYIVALMTQLLELPAHARVLEIGTGSGYQAAVLATFTRHVYSVEIIEPLATSARERLAALGFDNVTVRHGDGYAGWPEHAPFDGIIVTAAPAEIPPPLIEQLAVGGKLVVPVGTMEQNLRVVTRHERGHVTRDVAPVRFVPMTGRAAEDAELQP